MDYKLHVKLLKLPYLDLEPRLKTSHEPPSVPNCQTLGEDTSLRRTLVEPSKEPFAGPSKEALTPQPSTLKPLTPEPLNLENIKT